MRNKILIFTITFFVTVITAQQPVPNSNSEKGVTPLTTKNQQLTTKTYAVVIGISDYQDPGISDLLIGEKYISKHILVQTFIFVN